jgi:DNA-binding NarL/FixJ family response regulator
VGQRLLIVDDNPGFRRLAGRLFEREGYEVVGAVPTASEALAAAAELVPDVVLLDVNLPDQSGFEVAARLARECPDAAVLLTSTHGRSEFEQLARGSGARGFVPKEELTAAEVARVLT